MTQKTHSTVRDLSRIATCAAIIAVLGIPGQFMLGSGVPITVQTLGVMLAGVILGWWRGALSVLLVLVLVAAGLPLLAGGSGGIGVFFGPTGGYLIGWVFGAAVIGAIARGAATKIVAWRVALAVVVGGILVIYAFGIPVMANVLGMSLGEATVANLLFLPGDSIKGVITVLLAVGLWKAYPAAFALTPIRRTPRFVAAVQPGHEL